VRSVALAIALLLPGVALGQGFGSAQGSSSGGGSGDFLADGTVPMTGDLDLDTNSLLFDGATISEVTTGANTLLEIIGGGLELNGALEFDGSASIAALTTGANTVLELIGGGLTVNGDLDVGSSQVLFGSSTGLKEEAGGIVAATDGSTGYGGFVARDGSPANDSYAYGFDGVSNYGILYANSAVQIGAQNVVTFKVASSGVTLGRATSSYTDKNSCAGNMFTLYREFVVNDTEDTTLTGNSNTTGSAIIYTNEGDADGLVYTLPELTSSTLHVGIRYHFIVEEAQTFQIDCNSNDEIRYLDGTVDSDDSISSSTVGHYVEIVSTNTDTWQIIEDHGFTSGSTTYTLGGVDFDGNASIAALTTGANTALEIIGGGLAVNGDVDVNDDGRVVYGAGVDVFSQGELTTLVDGTATTVFSVVTGDGDMAGITISYTIEATDGTDHQSESGTVQVAIIDDAGEVAASTTISGAAVADSGATTLTPSVWSVVTTDDQSIEVQCLSDSDLTTSTHQIRWHAIVSGNVTLTVP